MSSLKRQLVVFLLSISLVSIELVWTRLFSAEFFYPFAFLALSLAILGLGLGALAVRLVPALTSEHRLGAMLSAAALSMLIAPPLVFRLGLDFEALFGNWPMIGRFAAAVILLGSAFVFGGMALAVIFRSHSSEMPRIYMADLVGAGAGAFIAILLMNAAGTQHAVFFASIPLIVAALLAARTWFKVVPLLLAGATALLSIYAAPHLQLPREERGPVIFQHWDAMAKIKLYGFGREYRSFNIDNMANTGTEAFDGDWNRPGRKPFEFGIDVSNLINRFEKTRFLSLGAGGGADVLQALQAGAAEIHAVEVNPQINRMLLSDDKKGYIIPSPEQAWIDEQIAQQKKAGEKVEIPPRLDPNKVVGMDEFSGYIYRDPRVKVATEDARAYVRRLNGNVDIIYSLSSNTFAALASGSFAMAENYLFTTEAFRDYWRALSPNGFVVMEHQFYMPRLVASVNDALRGLGVADPSLHYAVYDLPKMRRNVILLSKQPLTDEIRNNAFGPLTKEKFDDIHLLYPPLAGDEKNLIARIARDGWKSVQAEATINVSPTSDDRPFVGQMGLWKNLGKSSAEETPRQKKMRAMEVFGYPMSRVLLVTILAVLGVLILPLNLLPMFGRGATLGTIPWLYFFTIGVAFMAVEVVLIQKYTLLVGPSAYSVATILATLLVASGLGSMVSNRIGDRAPFVLIALWLAADALLFRHFFDALGTMTLGPRMLITAALVAPVGFFMGMPFPKAAMRVGHLVDWGFAVNGAASVLGGTAVLLVAFDYGFTAALLGAAILYLFAGLLLSRTAAWERESEESDATFVSPALEPAVQGATYETVN